MVLEKKIKKLLIYQIVIPLLLTIIIGIFILCLNQPITIHPTQLTSLNVSDLEQHFEISIDTIPTYFSSYAKISAGLSSPYINSFKIFQVKLSTDNNIFLNISFSNQDCKNNKNLAEVGSINLNNPINIVYGCIKVDPIMTPKDWTLFSLLCITLFGFFHTISKFLFNFCNKKKEEKPEACAED
jgi:hypothetical protein